MQQNSYNFLEGAPKIRVFFSTDILMECFTDFNGDGDAAEELIQLTKFKGISAYVTDYCLQKVGFYLSKPNISLGHEAVARIRALLEDRVIHINRGLIEDAKKLPIRNFDAAVEIACAMACNLHAIVTQSPDYFLDTPLPVIGIDDFLKRQALENLLQTPMPLAVITSNWQSFKDLDKRLLSDSRFQMNLYGTNERNNLTTLNLQYADLKKVNLSSTILRGADLRGADLQEAKLTFSSLYCARLSGANLCSADIRGANLSQAILNDSNLSFADLSTSNLSASDLSNAVLYEANLQGTNLQGTNLQNANLHGADLRGANLQGVRLQDANLILTKFGQNVGISEAMKVDLMQHGAVFLEDKLGNRSVSFKKEIL